MSRSSVISTVSQCRSGRPDYTAVTELPESRATTDQCAILYNRYHLAFEYSKDKDVLEVGCGSGIGLGYLARTARRVVGVDIDEANCRIARATYKGNSKVDVQPMDARDLQFDDAAFDVVILFEALYYLRDPAAFFRQAHRVTRPGGLLIVSSVNCAWGGFSPSPFSTRYFTAAELKEAMTQHGYEVRVMAGFPEATNGLRSAIAKIVRRIAIHLHLIPGTMKQKEWLKRVFYGQLKALPNELPANFAPVEPLIEATDPDDTRHYRMLYAIGTRL